MEGSHVGAHMTPLLNRDPIKAPPLLNRRRESSGRLDRFCLTYMTPLLNRDSIPAPTSWHSSGRGASSSPLSASHRPPRARRRRLRRRVPRVARRRPRRSKPVDRRHPSGALVARQRRPSGVPPPPPRLASDHSARRPPIPLERPPRPHDTLSECCPKLRRVQCPCEVGRPAARCLATRRCSGVGAVREERETSGGAAIAGRFPARADDLPSCAARRAGLAPGACQTASKGCRCERLVAFSRHSAARHSDPAAMRSRGELRRGA